MKRPRSRQRPTGGLTAFRKNFVLDHDIYIFVGVCMLLGGGPGGLNAQFFGIALSGLYILISSIWKGKLAQLFELPMLAQAAVIGAIILPLAQLVPLPPATWQNLPGHELRAEILTTLGAAGIWLPLSIAPAETAYTAVMTLSVFGLFLSILPLPSDRLRSVLLFVTAFIALGVAIGLMQVFSGGKLLEFYPVSHRGMLIGFFANKNHMGLVLACSIPLCYFLIRDRIFASDAVGFFYIILIVVVMGLLVATNSRAGLALGGAAVVLVAMRHFSAHRIRVLGLAGGLVVLFVAISSFVPVIGDLLGRVGDAQDDLRGDFVERSAPLIWQYGTVGSGLGSFTYVYAPTEKLEWVNGAYLNHLHNEYLQLIIEAGIAGLVIMALWFGAFFQAAMRLRSAQNGKSLWSSDLGDLSWLGAVIIGLFLAHSIVDYPIRRMGSLVILAIAASIFFYPMVTRISAGRGITLRP